MAAENDNATGFDFSALSTVTKAQLLQAINQILVLVGRGMVYIGSTRPDILNNIRYVDFLWIDTTASLAPVVKVNKHAGLRTTVAAATADPANQWDAVVAGTDSVVTTSILDDSITIAKLKQDEGNALQLLRWDSAGTAIEFVDPTNIIPSGQLLLSALSVSAGSSDSNLWRDGTDTISWRTTTDLATAINAKITEITFGQITSTGVAGPGAVLYNASGNWTAPVLVPSLIDNDSGTEGQAMILDSASLWQPTTLGMGKKYEATSDGTLATVISTGQGTVVTGGLLAGVIQLNHGLGSVPSLIVVDLICTAAGGDTNTLHALNDVVSLDSLLNDIGAGSPQFHPTVVHTMSTATGLMVKISKTYTSFSMVKKTLTNGTEGASLATVVNASWNVRIRAWK